MGKTLHDRVRLKSRYSLRDIGRRPVAVAAAALLLGAILLAAQFLK